MIKKGKKRDLTNPLKYATLVANEVAMVNLVERLKEIQTREQLSDSGFAAKLGISRQQWQFTKAGTRSIGEKTINGILVNIPELTVEVLVYLREKNGD